MRLFIILVVLSVSSAAFALDANSSFPQFCEEWMQKLVVREQRNVSHIQWQQESNGVKGSYIGYTQEHTCTTKVGTASVPVGKISYREIRYEKSGPSIVAAESSRPHPVETTEITEIFRYDAGKWIY